MAQTRATPGLGHLVLCGVHKNCSHPRVYQITNVAISAVAISCPSSDLATLPLEGGKRVMVHGQGQVVWLSGASAQGGSRGPNCVAG